MTIKRRRVDLYDEDVPAFVTEPVRKVPRCCSCGRDVITARSLWTLCEECIRQSLEIPATPMSRHPQGTHGMICELAKKMRLTLAHGDGSRVKEIPSSVLWHAERLRVRGIEESVVMSLAKSLAVDPVHRAGCDRCKADLSAIESTLLRPQEETARLASIGVYYLPRRSTVKSPPVA